MQEQSRSRKKREIMEGRKRKFNGAGVQHIYQRAYDWGVIFYNEKDRLVLTTLIITKARKYDVKVLSAAIMYTHIHLSIKCESKTTMSKFVNDYTSAFVRSYNYRNHRQGVLFHHHFGWASKVSKKSIRNNLSYVANNHVEKKICSSVLLTRWNFLAYWDNENPFSTQSSVESSEMKRYKNLVRKRCRENKPINYEQLDNMDCRLSPAEMERMIDYIIFTYRIIEYDIIAGFYNSFEEMIIAFDSTTGSEYEITEEYISESDKGYMELISFMWADGMNRVYQMSDEEKMDLAKRMYSSTRASKRQIRKFLHL